MNEYRTMYQTVKERRSLREIINKRRLQEAGVLKNGL